MYTKISTENAFTSSSAVSANFFQKPICLYISCYQGKSSMISTTIDRKSLYFYEMCSKKDNSQLIPLSFLLTTNPSSKNALLQWLHMFFDAVEKQFCYSNTTAKNKLHIICDHSLPLVESILELNHISFSSYMNICFKRSTQLCFINKRSLENEVINSSFIDNLNKELLLEFDSDRSSNGEHEIAIHICTNQFMDEMITLSRRFYRSNVNFAMNAFSCLVNCQTLIELEQCLYAFMCILYSKHLNSLVNNSFSFLKSRFNFYVTQSKKKSKKDSGEIYIYKTQTIKRNHKQFKNKHNISESGDENVERNHLRHHLEVIRMDERNQSSVFYKMCEKLFEKSKLECDLFENGDDVVQAKINNAHMGHELLYNFLRRFAASMPLWINKNVFFLSSHQVRI